MATKWISTALWHGKTPSLSYLGVVMSRHIHKITDVETSEVEFTEPIRRFFEDHQLMDCIFSNDEGEIGMIAVDDIVLDELDMVIDWNIQPEDSDLSKFKQRIEKDLKETSLVHYRIY